MTDELDPVTPPAATPPVAAPAAVAEPPIPPADPDEAQAIEVQGGKMVPLAALKAAREEARAGKDAAARVQQLERELAAAKPYQDFVAANPQILQRPEPVPVAPNPDADPELIEIARALDYYDKDGKLDLERAKKFDTLSQRRAERMIGQAVQPVAQSVAQQQSNANWTQVVSTPVNGQTLNPQILGEFWRHLPADKTADPRVAAMVRDLAYTEQMRRSPLPNQPPPPPGPPVHTENIGRVAQPAARLSALEQSVAEQRGMSEDKFRDAVKGFTPGRMNKLED